MILIARLRVERAERRGVVWVRDDERLRWSNRRLRRTRPTSEGQ